MIRKEVFVETLNKIQIGDQKIKEASMAVEALTNEYIDINVHSSYHEALINLLEEIMDDNDGTIFWWLYADLEKKIWHHPYTEYNDSDEELVFDVSTPEKLYDYLVNFS